MNGLFWRKHLIVYEYFVSGIFAQRQLIARFRSTPIDKSNSTCLFDDERAVPISTRSQVSPDTRARVTRKGKRISHLSTLVRENGLDRLNL